MDDVCPCGSDKAFAECCEPLLKGERKAQTAEELMRSRYTAYVKTNVPYIFQTTSPKQRDTLDEKATRSWSEKTQWHKLEIVRTEGGGPQDSTGTVEFIAHFAEKGARRKHHEVGHFKKHDDTWLYEDGDLPAPKQVVRDAPRVGRNEPCPCGSGKKYKKCCGKMMEQESVAA